MTRLEIFGSTDHANSGLGHAKSREILRALSHAMSGLDTEEACQVQSECQQILSRFDPVVSFNRDPNLETVEALAKIKPRPELQGSGDIWLRDWARQELGKKWPIPIPEVAIAHYKHQRALDNIPCPKCGGDRLRADFTENPRCHAPMPAAEISDTQIDVAAKAI